MNKAPTNPHDVVFHLEKLTICAKSFQREKTNDHRGTGRENARAGNSDGRSANVVLPFIARVNQADGNALGRHGRSESGETEGLLTRLVRQRSRANAGGVSQHEIGWVHVADALQEWAHGLGPDFLSQLGPDHLPIVRTHVFASNNALGQRLNGRCNLGGASAVSIGDVLKVPTAGAALFCERLFLLLGERRVIVFEVHAQLHHTVILLVNTVR